MAELWQALEQLGRALAALAVAFSSFLLQWSLLIAWLAWWIAAVNWRRLWPTLARGAWLPVALLLVMAAIVWSRVSPGDHVLFGSVHVSALGWHLGAVGIIAGLAFLCGWLQGILGWAPAEMEIEPPPPTAHAAEAHH